MTQVHTAVLVGPRWAQLELMAHALRERGVSVVHVDSRALGGSRHTRVAQEGQSARAWLGGVALEAGTAVWVQAAPPLVPTELAAAARGEAAVDADLATLAGAIARRRGLRALLWNVLDAGAGRGARVLNFPAPDFGQDKLAGLRAAAAAGLRVPPTTLDASVPELAPERAAQDEAMWHKPLLGGVRTGQPCPAGTAALHQARVQGPLWRVFLARERVVGALCGPATHMMQPAVLPVMVASALGAVAAALDVDFGAADLMGPAHTPVFLELNAAPLFAVDDLALDGAVVQAWAAAMCGLDVASA